MEHLITFSVSIDDEHIQKSVLETAEKKIIADLQDDIISKLFSSPSYRQTTSKDPLSDLSKDILEKVIRENKDDIIRAAAEHLAKSLPKTKKVKEWLAKLDE